MSNLLPESWADVNLFDLCTPKQWKTIPKNALNDSNPYPVYGANGIIGYYNQYTHENPTLMIGCRGSCGTIHVSKPYSYINGNAMALDDLNINACKINYLKYYLINRDFKDVITGTTQPQITQQNLRKVRIPLAPYNEQIRIADKIDELFSELDNGIEELETAQKKLALYRQSLLKSAVEGELSKEWRESQTEISETGEQLLARILKERRERWEQEKLKEFAEKGKNPPKNWQEKYPEPIQPDTKNLPQLPEGWVWATLDSLSYLITSGSRGWGQYYSDSGSLFIRAQNIKNDVLNYEDIAYVQLPLNTEGLRTKVDELDILITITGANVAKTALVEVVLDEAYINQHISLVKLIDKTISYYVHLYLINDFGGRKQLLDVAYGAGKPGLNLSQVANTHIPLPNTNEINFIVDLLKLKLEEVSETQIQNLNLIKKTSLQKTNILDKAFSGNLISQDPNDEPAQVLLERIQQQRETEALVKKATPKKRSTQKVKKEIGMSKTILEILQQQSDWISGQDLATAFGLNGNSKIEEIEQFYEQLRTLSLDEKILVKPDQQNKKEQDLIKLKDKTDAS